MPVSSESMKKIQLRGERSMSCHDATSTTGIKKVVSSVSSRLMPSMPTNQWMPYCGSQGAYSMNW